MSVAKERKESNTKKRKKYISFYLFIYPSIHYISILIPPFYF